MKINVPLHKIFRYNKQLAAKLWEGYPVMIQPDETGDIVVRAMDPVTRVYDSIGQIPEDSADADAKFAHYPALQIVHQIAARQNQWPIASRLTKHYVFHRPEYAEPWLAMQVEIDTGE